MTFSIMFNISSFRIGVKTITFLQALGILLLSKILFGGFGGRRGGRGRHWKNNIEEKSKHENHGSQERH